MRILWTIGGLLAVGLGMIGAVLPLVPTVPFLLLAAFCFARGSDRLHDWLMQHPKLGPPIRDWREHRAIGRGSKRAAMVAIALAFFMSLALGVSGEILAVQAVALGGAAAFILTRPERPVA